MHEDGEDRVLPSETTDREEGPDHKQGGVPAPSAGWLVAVPLYLVRSALVTVGMIAAVPLGVLSLLLILIDPPLQLWFLPLLLPSEWQVLAALGFLISGGLLTWVGLRFPRWLGPWLLRRHPGATRGGRSRKGAHDNGREFRP